MIFYELGLGEVIGISSSRGWALGDLLDLVISGLGE